MQRSNAQVFVPIVLLAAAQFAQGQFPQSNQQYDTYPVRIVGGSGDQGKCTIEVTVDGVAEVEMKGSDARLRTVSGARAMWRKVECNQPQPLNPAEFRFTARDGRGRQFLLRAPQENNGVTLVRIEDEAGGSGNYKFELTWHVGGPGPKDGGVRMTGGVPSGGPGGVIAGPPVSGWSDTVNFRGSGDGYLRTFHGGDSLILDAVVNIDSRGRVHVELVTNQRERLILEGRLLNIDSNRLTADMSGSAIRGTMELLLDNRNRVEELALTGVGRNRSELRWQAK
ncbi:MAG: hypothetical protein ABI824_07590 [Acidobacteriota bacterium]